MGRTIALYGDTGSGKTTLAGEKAKDDYKRTKRPSILFGSDLGGSESIKNLINLGVVDRRVFNPQVDDPWVWIDDAINLKDKGKVANVIFDSATSISESILSYITKSDMKVGQQATQKFNVQAKGRSLIVGANNQAHYGLVQTFMLDEIWKSTWIANGDGPDVIWTFSTDRGERENDSPVLGPKLAGHALTAAIPKWFNYTFRLTSIPQFDMPPTHRLYLQEQTENGGMITGFGNSRYPLDASTPLPLCLEPASLVEALRLIEQGQDESLAKLKEELGC